MTPSPLTCEASTSVSDLAQRMIDEKIDALPVMSGTRLVGLVTSTDLLQLLVDREEHRVLPFRFELRDIESGAVA
jgi:CBS domain-containing protein